MVLTAAFSRAPGAAQPRPGMLRGLWVSLEPWESLPLMRKMFPIFVPRLSGTGTGSGCCRMCPWGSQGRESGQAHPTSCGTNSHKELLPHD